MIKGGINMAGMTNPAIKNLESRMNELEREMSDFTTVLKSITQGAGNFTYMHERYEQLPQQLLKDVLLQN